MRLTRLFLILIFFSTQVFAQDTVALNALRAAYLAKEKGNWDEALRLARPAGDVGVDLIEWDRLRAGKGEFVEAQNFLSRRPDWPGLPYLRKRSEATIGPDALAQDVIAFFDGTAPRTAQGSLRLAQALTKKGQVNAAIAAAQWGWTSFSMGAELEQEFREAFGADLVTMHEVRLDVLLWQGDTSSARRMLSSVSSDQAKLAKARLALQKNKSGIIALLADVPESAKADPGLAFDTFQWHLARKRSDKAIKLLLKHSANAIDLGQAAKWAGPRLSVARDLLWDQKYQTAYSVAAGHHLGLSSAYAELEWLAGFIALRKLNKPKLALVHFKNHESAVGSEISLGRTYYWQGRALQAMGQSERAQRAYARGAKHQTSFYGLLSSEVAGLPMQASLAGSALSPDWRRSRFVESSVFKAGLLLISVDRSRYGVRFLTHLAESQSPVGMAQLGGMAEELGIPYLELMLAKRFSQYDVMLERHFYPLSPLLVQTDGISPELALAIARRESEFFTGAVSGVGALGLMQVMPRTAQEMSGKLGLRYSRSKMLKDPKFNTKIGIRYLEELLEEFGNSPVHIAAAYNAGPSRARNWTNKLGDPRLGEIDVIDWIEQIPFSETRNYVMRVTESLPNYRARLAGQVAPLNFLAELKGNYRVPPANASPAISLRPVSRLD